MKDEKSVQQNNNNKEKKKLTKRAPAIIEKDEEMRVYEKQNKAQLCKRNEPSAACVCLGTNKIK